MAENVSVSWLQWERERRYSPEARGFAKVMFFTPEGFAVEDALLELARGMFARMRAAASARLAWSSVGDTMRAAASSPPSAFRPC